MQKAIADGAPDEKAAQFAATREFNRRVVQIKAQKKLPAATPTPTRTEPAPTHTAKPVTQGGARVTPPGNPSRPPAPKPDPEAEFNRKVGKDIFKLLR